MSAVYGEEVCELGMKEPVDQRLLVLRSAVEYGAARTLMLVREGEGEARPRLPLRMDIRLVWRGDMTGERGVELVDMFSADLWV